MLNFNGLDIPSFIKIKAVNIKVLPSISNNLISIVGSYGRLAGTVDVGEKIISCEFTLIKPSDKSIQECGREFAAWLRGNNFKESDLIIKDDSSVKYKAIVNDSTELKDLLYAATGTINFVVPSGCAEDVAPKTITGDTQVTAVNEGTVHTYPIIKITVKNTVADSLAVQNVTTGKKIILNSTFNGGDVVVFDCKRSVITVNDNVSMSIINLDSDFFNLCLGENIIKSSVADVIVEVTYTQRYL